MDPQVDVTTAGAPASALAHLRHVDAVLAKLIDAHPGFHPRAWLADLPPMDAFGALVFQVAGQQLSLPATRRIIGRIQQRFGGSLPTPPQVLATTADDLRELGLSRRKVATLQDLAARFVRGELSDETLRALADEEVEARLVEIPGIGPWTVQGVLIIAFGRDGVVLPGDLALRKSIQRAYELDHLPSQDEVREIAEPWRPFRSLASAYLFQQAFGEAG